VPSFEGLHLHPVIAATLERLGWQPDDLLAKDAAPSVARGHNLVAITPPVPAYATPILAALLSRLEQGKRGLVLVPPAQLEEWGALLHLLSEGTGCRIHVARGIARAMRRLRADTLDALVTTPEAALELVGRSALRMESIDSLVVAWPENLLDQDGTTPLLQDLGKEAQRIVFTSEPERVGALGERYARKALTMGTQSWPLPAGPVRTASVPWSGRIRGLADLIELIDPASLAIWTVDRRHHEALAQITASNQSDVHLVTREVPTAEAIVAFDLPTAERLRQLLTAGEVFLLVPPGTETYVSRIAAPRRPVQLPGALDLLHSEQAAQRSAVLKAIDTANLGPALLTLAPLFERHDAATVAAAVYELWRGSAPAAPPQPPAAATSKVFVGVGKKDGANPNELVAVLTKELRVERAKIGRIELRDAYSLIELPAQEAEQVASALNGHTIRRKRVTARVDRGPKRPGRSDGRDVDRTRRGDRR
jgi:hypothetical protein